MFVFSTRNYKRLAAWRFVVPVLFGSLGVAPASLAQASPEEIEPRIVVEMGSGRVQVETNGFELSESALATLETDLLVDDTLAEIVTRDSPTRVELVGGEVEQLRRRLRQHDSETAAAIRSLVVRDLKGEEDQRLRSDVGEENREFYFDQSVTVAPGTRREDLVVIGGSAYIEGEVNDLVVIGGNARVLAGGRVIQDLVVIGGTLEVDPGGSVPEETYVLSAWHVRPWLRHRVGTWWGSVWIQVLLVGLGIIWSFLVLRFFEMHGPGFRGRLLATIATQKVKSLMWGALLVMLVPMLSIALVVSIIGWVLLPAWVTLLFLGWAVAYAWVIDVLGRSVALSREMPLMVRVAIGQMLWLALGWLPVVGSAIRVMLLALVIGAIVKACQLGGRLTPDAQAPHN